MESFKNFLITESKKVPVGFRFKFDNSFDETAAWPHILKYFGMSKYSSGIIKSFMYESGKNVFNFIEPYDKSKYPLTKETAKELEESVKLGIINNHKGNLFSFTVRLVTAEHKLDNIIPNNGFDNVYKRIFSKANEGNNRIDAKVKGEPGSYRFTAVKGNREGVYYVYFREGLYIARSYVMFVKGKGAYKSYDETPSDLRAEFKEMERLKMSKL